jgi:hypothetical protein
MKSFATPRELADEMEGALRETAMTPQEHWEFLIQHGIIDREGRVLVNKYFPTDPPEGSNGPPPRSEVSEKSETRPASGN